MGSFGRLPNFFILGAGRCGTTSLHRYLGQHPDVFMAPVKEPSFFCEPFQVVANPIQYAKLFEAVRDETAVGEASHVYLTHPDSARTLRAFFPQARFVLVFRHPADRAHSLYHHMRRYGYETARTFERALAIEDRRYHSRWFHKHCGQYLYNFLYFRSGLFGEQVDRYFSLFDRGQFHILSLSELKEHPVPTLQKIFAFLDVDPDFVPAIKVFNQGWTSRSAWLQRMVDQKLRRPLWLRRMGMAWAAKHNITAVPPMDPGTRQELCRRYGEDLKRFYELTGVCLEAEAPVLS